MEAVPRLPMLSLDLKTSPESPQFGPKLKQYIAECYREDPESYNNEIHQLEGLRSAAVRPAIDKTGLVALKRYFCQLRGLQSRFPMAKGQPAAVTFAWRDLFANIVCPLADVRFETVCILYNIGALHCKLGTAELRMTQESMKTACTNFQCAVWAFQHLKEHYPQPSGVDLSPEIMKLFQDICLAQAQECILEKSMQDSRKPAIIAAIGAQAVHHYKSALSALESSHSSDSLHETVGVKICNAWAKSISFKVAYISCIVYLFQGMQSEEQQRMGERVAYYQAASDKLQESKKLSKGLPQIEAINEAITFTNDIVEGKRKAAKNENEFIYHEEVPEKDTLNEAKPASLAKGIAINFNDPEVSGSDIFGRLVPMRAHEASSMYSEEKAKLLRRIGSSVEMKDAQLNDFMSSLQLEELNVLNDPERLPQDLIDMCASLSVKTDAIQNLVETMNTLADIHTEVDTTFAEIKNMIEEEENNEKEFQQIMGKRPPSNVSTELSREANKYLEAHNKANESNQTLHKAMTLHLANLKLLCLPLDDLEKNVPSLESIRAQIDNHAIAEMRGLVEKVNEMRAQRSMLVLQLREAVNSDDITSQLLTRTGESLDEIFKQEIEKHNQTVTLIEQNMTAQENILKALTDAYAKYAPSRKIISDVLRKREAFFNAMTTSYETYEDLMKKSLKGIEFYKKLSSTVQRLYSRLKSICKVQQEERSQLLASHVPKINTVTPVPAPKSVTAKELGMNPSNLLPKEETSTAPKLKDFLPYMKNRNATQNINVADNTMDSAYTGQLYPPHVRPAPLGSEGTNDIPPKYSDTVLPKSQYLPTYDTYKGYQLNQPMQYPEQTYAYPVFDQTNQYHRYQPYNAEKDATEKTNPYAYQNMPVAMSETNQNPAVYVSNSASYPANVSSYTGAAMDYNAYNNSNKMTDTQDTSYAHNQNYTNYNVQPTYTDTSQIDNQMQSMNISSQQTGYNYDNSYTGATNAYDTSLQYQNMYPGVVQQTTDLPTVLPQQNLNINPAHISSMNYAKTQTYQTNQTPQSYTNPYVQQEVSEEYKACVAPVVEDVSSDKSQYMQNYYYPTNVSAVGTDTAKNLSPAPTSDALPIQSHVHRDFLSKNTTSTYPSYNNTYYDSNTIATTNTATDQQYPGYTNQTQPNYNSAYQYHPEYTYNMNTGVYDYNYGYRNNSSTALPTETQQHNVYTNAGAYSTTQTASTPVEVKQSFPVSHSDYGTQHYSLPYGLQNNTITEETSVTSEQTQNTSQGNEQMKTNTQNSVTYMSANDTTTSTTKSNQGKTEAISSSFSEAKVEVKPEEPKKEPSSIDLLSGLDFSIEQPPLMPEIRVPPVSECVIRKLPFKELEDHPPKPIIEKEVICRPPKRDIFSDPSLLNKFTQEVKNMQVFVDGFTKKTHSGITMLDSKWKKIQESQAKENHSKTINAAKNNLAKNVSPDVVPYDDARVEIKSENEETYVNASYLKQISSWCFPLIMTDLPSEENYGAFWEMVFQQKVAVMVCLLTEIELQGKFYGPTAKSQILEFPSNISVTLDEINCNVNWTERQLTVTYKRVQHKITHYQINVFPARVVSAPLVMLVDKILKTKDQNIPDNNFPMTLIHCSTGAGRSSLIVLLLMVISQVRAGFIDLRDMLDSGILYLCSTRTNVLEDTKYLVDIYRTVLFYVQGVLCSGTLNFTGETISVPSGASIPPPIISTHSKKIDNFNKFSKESFEEMKQAAGLKSGDMQDPLSYLDPLWSLKKRKE